MNILDSRKISLVIRFSRLSPGVYGTAERKNSLSSSVTTNNDKVRLKKKLVVQYKGKKVLKNDIKFFFKTSPRLTKNE